MLSKEFLLEYDLRSLPMIAFPNMLIFVSPHVQERLDYREPDRTNPLGYQKKTMADVMKIINKIGHKGIKYQNRVDFEQYWVSDMSANMSVGLNRIIGSGKYQDKPGLMINLLGTVLTPDINGDYVVPKSEGKIPQPVYKIA